MPKDNAKRIRGQQASMVGFTYENLWRALIILQLQPQDSLRTNSAEDVHVIGADGTESLVQIKYRSEAAPASLFLSEFKNVESVLSGNSQMRYHFIVNVPVARNAQLQQILFAFGDRIILEDNAASLPDLPARVRDQLRALFTNHPDFSPREIGSHLTTGMIEFCFEKLLIVASKDTPRITRSSLWQQAGISDLAAMLNASIVRGAIIPWRLFVGSDESIGPGHEVLATIRAGSTIPRDVEVGVLIQARLALKSTDKRTHCIVISGQLLSGKTVLLGRLGWALQGSEDVYWSDERHIEQDLIINWAMTRDRPGRAVLLIDNALEDSFAIDRHVLWDLLEAKTNLLIIAATSKPEEALSPVARKNNVYIRGLSRSPTFGEARRLGALFPRPALSQREVHILHFGDFRFGLKILARKSLPTPSPSSLITSAFIDSHVMAVVACTALGVKLPVDLLRKREDVSTSHMALNSELYIYETTRHGTTVVFHDASLARLSLRTIIQDQSVSVAGGLEHCIRDLLRIMKPERFIHRRAMRHILEGLRRFDQSIYISVVVECAAPIHNVSLAEPKAALVRYWYGIARRSIGEARNILDDAVLAASRKALLDIPRSEWDALSILRIMGEAIATERVALAIYTSDPEPWRHLIPILGKFGYHSQRRLVNDLLDILYSDPARTFPILDDANVTQQLASLVTSHARPEYRRRFADEMMGGVLAHGSHSHQWLRMLPNALTLTERSRLQERNHLSMAATNAIVNGLPFSAPEFTRKIDDLVSGDDWFWGEKLTKQLIAILPVKSSERLGDLSTAWAAILSFARNWLEDEDIFVVWSQCHKFVADTAELGAGYELLNNPMRELLFMGRSRLRGQEAVLNGSAALFRIRSSLAITNTITYAITAIPFAGMLLQWPTGTFRVEAFALLKRCLHEGWSQGVHNDFDAILVNLVGTPGQYVAPMKVSPEFWSSVLAPLVLNLSFAPEAADYADEIEKALASAPACWMAVAQCLYKLRQYDRAASVIRKYDAGSPDGLLLTAACSAASGDLPACKKILQFHSNNMLTNSAKGARPTVLRILFRSLAEADPASAQIWSNLQRLVSTRVPALEFS